jgi:F-type H+-transporting ATPase subunit b
MQNIVPLQDPAVWVAISFAIFAVIAFVFGRGALLGKLDARIADVKREIGTAETLRAQAQALLDEYKQKQKDAEKEAADILKRAKASAEEIRRQAEADLEEISARREAQLADRLKRMEDAAIQEIRAHAADLALKATTEIITSQMDKDANDRLVDESIPGLAKQLAA